MHKPLHPGDDVDRLYVSRKEGFKSIKDSDDATVQRLHRKTRRKIDYSHQKQYWKHEDQQNEKNEKTKMERTTIWTFYAIKKWHLTQENMDMAMKGKP